MRGNWKRHLILAAVFAAGIVQVTDVFAIWPFRRRVYNDGYYNQPAYGTTYGTATAPMYGSAPAYGVAPASATVAAPGVGVNAGPAGANVVAPGVGLNAGDSILFTERGQNAVGPLGAWVNLYDDVNISTVPAVKLRFFSRSRLRNDRSVAVAVWTMKR